MALSKPSTAERSVTSSDSFIGLIFIGIAIAIGIGIDLHLALKTACSDFDPDFDVLPADIFLHGFPGNDIPLKKGSAVVMEKGKCLPQDRAG